MTSRNFDWSPHLQHIASSDVGMRRANNQDSFAVSLAADFSDWEQRGHLFVVADGMGAHAAGELASKLAVENVAHIYRKHPELSPPEGLEMAIREANQEIHRRGEANLDFHNMGTTCSCLLLLPQGAIVGHVGDSRVYRVRGQKIEQLTFDHSLVWEMREAGQIAGLDEESAVPKNVITRSLGPQPSVKVDVEGPHPLAIGDTFLLCSDGLTGRIDDGEIGTILTSLSPALGAELLIHLANLRGGPDNITAIVIRVVSQEMVAAAGQVAPLVLGTAKNRPPPLHVGWWLGTGVCGLLALTLWATGKSTWSWLPAIACAALITVIMILKFNPFGPDLLRLGGGRRLGKGPHRRASIMPIEEFIQQQLDAFATAKRSIAARNWEVDWDALDRLVSRIREQLSAGRPDDACTTLVEASGLLAETLKTYARN